MTRHQLPAAESTTAAQRYTALAVLATTQLMVVLDGLVMLIALPSIQVDLDMAPEDSQWVVTAYALALGSLLLLGGRVSDYWGRKRAFLVGLAGFTAASAFGGLAQNDLMLFAARALQGVTAALLVPAALSLISVTFTEPRERARAFAVYSAVSGSGVAAGLLVGGLLTEYTTWRWCLLVNLPIGAVVFLAAIPVLTESRLPGRARYDLPGTATATAGLAALVYGFSRAATDGWSDAVTIGSLAASGVLVAAFGFIETRVAQPLLPLRLLDRTRTASILGAMFQFAALIPLFFFLIYFLQGIKGFSPMKCGLALLPYALAAIVAAAVMEQRIGRMPPKVPAALGLLVAAVCSIWFSFLDADWSYWSYFFPVLVILGTGVLLTFISTSTLSQANTPDDDAGVVSALYNAMLQVGIAIGPALLTTVSVKVTEHSAGDAPPGVPDVIDGYRAGILGSVIIFVVGAVVSFVLIPSGSARARAAVPTGPLLREQIGGIEGLVSTSSGSPVPGAWLTLIGPAGAQVDRVDTGGDGRFRIRPPGPGRYLLVCTTPDRPPRASMISVNGQGAQHDIVLGTPGEMHRLTGVVRDADSGRAVADATVVLTGADGPLTVRTGQDGAFGFDGLAAGSYQLSATAKRTSTTPVKVPSGSVDPVI